jgi:hypothetical protein
VKSAHRDDILLSLIEQGALQLFMRGFTHDEIVLSESRRASLDGLNNREGVHSAETPEKKILRFPHFEHPIDEVFRLFALTEQMP